MALTSYRSQIRTLKQGDRHFRIQDQYTIAPRAGFEISAHCPVEYKMVLTECINKGWLKPIANVTERELLFMGLST